ncbi:hypothetical protein EU527_02375 [Candidatus Thorarchaeota archaeon]|nr:MAG: hypothetical protein EU527_02375 [Candidatus Thorarchaeota archaeon]
MNRKFYGVLVCIIMVTSLPILATDAVSILCNYQIADSFEDYQELQLLPDTTLSSEYDFEKNDNHNVFQTQPLSPGVELIWTHHEGIELDFRYPKDRTMNLPDCEEYALVSESFSWDYNVIPTKLDVHVQYEVQLDGDFDAVTYPVLFKVYFWVIDSSNQWTLLYNSVTGTPGITNIHVNPSFQSVYRGWNGVIEDDKGVQNDPSDILKFTVGISPTYEFYENENNYWNWMSGAVKVKVTSMILSCIVNANPEEKELLSPTHIGVSGTLHDDICSDVAFLNDGSVYVIGTSYSDENNLLLTKWNSKGNILWTRIISGGGSWVGSGITTDDTSVIATGGISNSEESDTIVVKWNHRGVLLWNKTIDFGFLDYGYSVDIGYDGSIYILGKVEGNVAPITYLAKLNSDGMVLWNQTCGNPFYDRPLDIGVDYDGYIYTATLQNISKWNSDGFLQWTRTEVYGSVKVTREGELYSTRVFYPRNLLQQWHTDGTKGWNISLSYNHTYFGHSLLQPMLLDVIPAGWSYVLSFSTLGLPNVFISIYDTEGRHIWNKTINPQFLSDPYYYLSGNHFAVHETGYVCFASSTMTSDGDLDFCVQLYLSEREDPIISSPVTILLIAVAAILIVAIPLDYIRRRKQFKEQEIPDFFATQVYLVS